MVSLQLPVCLETSDWSAASHQVKGVLSSAMKENGGQYVMTASPTLMLKLSAGRQGYLLMVNFTESTKLLPGFYLGERENK